ncbi:MAG: hypothetical protein PW788_00885 [Micavibrio sp.]|nr:hypothetical protein [Micavibrio sp.]
MGMFDWIGRGKREAAWMAEERRLPDGAEAIPEGDPRWMVSQEFCLEKAKNVRFYYAARPNEDRPDAWVISKIQYDLKQPEDTVDFWDVDHVYTPLQVVNALRNFERRSHNDETYLFVDGHRSTYRAFANNNGIHFDDNGAIIEVSADTRLSKGVFMNREALDALFHNAAVKTPPLDSWEQVYAQIVDKWPAQWEVMHSVPVLPEDLVLPPAEKAIAPEVMTVEEKQEADVTAVPAEKAATQDAGPAVDKPAEDKPAEEAPKPEEKKRVIEVFKLVNRPIVMTDVTDSKAYSQYAHSANYLMQQIKKLPEAVMNGNAAYAIRNVQRSRLATEYDSARGKLADRLVDATILVGLLRAGAHLYAETLGKGNYAPEHIRSLSAIGDSCVEIATERLGVKEDDAKKISDVITRGGDPFGPELPLEKIFAAYPAPAFDPPPPANPYKNTPGKNTVSKTVPKRRY